MIYVITGATASGKTALSLRFAKAIGAHIINADAFQVYRGLDIGTAKASLNQRQEIPHHLIDIVDPDQGYDVRAYQSDARNVIDDLNKKNIPIIIVGGTGLYIRAALFDYFFPQHNQDFAPIDTTKSNQELHEQLQSIDADAAKNIHPNNRKRIIRALEIFYATGISKSEHLHKVAPNQLYDALFVGIKHDRTMLYERVNRRVLDMVSAGLLDEVRSLYDRYGKNARALQAIGYKEFFPYFEGQATLQEAIIKLQQANRNYIKRQDTFFKHQLPMTWFANADEAFAYLMRAHEHNGSTT
ncbi:MAG TPA: tRNA (adenosine(37)-N6)-dimethylallyltransferase MiaA [Bacilli bacterium]|nr:tRNA (adenosine(37)-N6)-dimethylallyltransferase MiaA [Bacilli bacterium]